MGDQTAIPRENRLDPMADPRKLAWFGQIVRDRLLRHPSVRRIDTADAEIFEVEGFLKRRDCNEIVKVINRRATPSTLYRGTEREGFRTSFTHHFEPHDPLTRSCELYISDLLGIDDNYSETMQGQRYSTGQEFKHHFDYLHVGDGYWRDEAHRGGQRTWTAMICLHAPREGGETDFPKLGLKFQPKVGTLLVWNNMTPQGFPNPKTLHAGTPVIRGTKHIITKWYRQERWRLLNPV
ncbi:prolyl hydroxylase family protein [Erythrobacter sp. GH1-10]|uniref:prolyl hydroxylase family protein n=1 Tax=Erythrobacter sp. GH1-10 TaxID=3349334 RepID=UPI003877C54E